MLISIYADYIKKYSYFLLKKCENLLQCKKFSHFSNKKFQHICNIYVENFNKMLTNVIVNFQQPASDLLLQRDKTLAAGRNKAYHSI